MIEHFKALFKYEADCTELVIGELRAAKAHIEQVGLASLVAPYDRAVAIFSHMQAARRVWLHRLASDLTQFPPDGLFPAWSVEKAEAEARELDGLWTDWLRRLPAANLDSAIRYTSTEGAIYESRLVDVLTHAVNHSSYHRGQIATLIAHCGVKPAVTDFIALTRRRV